MTFTCIKKAVVDSNEIYFLKYCTLVHFLSICTLLEYLHFWILITFTPLHFKDKCFTFNSLHLAEGCEVLATFRSSVTSYKVL